MLKSLPSLRALLEDTTPFQAAVSKFNRRFERVQADAPKSYKESHEKALKAWANEAEKLASNVDEIATAADMKAKAKAFSMSVYKDQSGRTKFR